MSASEPGSPDLDGILTSRRIGAAFGVFTDPTAVTATTPSVSAKPNAT